MTLVGLAARKLMNKKRNAKLAAAFPNGIRCQKCLEMGHWSYECKDKRKFVHRSSRTKQLNKRLADKRSAESSAISEETTQNGKTTKSIKQPKEKRRKRSNSTSGSSSDDSSSSESSSTTDSDDDTGSSDSDEDSSDSTSSSSDSDSDSSDSETDSTNSGSSDSSSDGDADSEKECNNEAPKNIKPLRHSTEGSSASSSDDETRFQN